MGSESYNDSRREFVYRETDKLFYRLFFRHANKYTPDELELFITECLKELVKKENNKKRKFL